MLPIFSRLHFYPNQAFLQFQKLEMHNGTIVFYKSHSNMIATKPTPVRNYSKRNVFNWIYLPKRNIKEFTFPN